MKKIYFGYILAMLCLFVQSCRKEDILQEKKFKPNSTSEINTDIIGSLYYWSDGKKQALTEDLSAVVFTASDSVKAIRTIRSKSDISFVNKLNKEYFLLESKSRVDISVMPSDAIVQKVYKTTDGNRLIPTGELSVRPKSGVSIEQVISSAGAKLSVIRKSRRGTFYLKLNEQKSLLELANKIYEGGQVVFSIPNFIANIKGASLDPFYAYQYYLNNTGQFGATPGIDINLGTTLGTSSEIKVAVIDYGVEAHEDLGSRLLQGFTPGYPTEYGAPAAANVVHGQAVAGIIAATRDNNLGIAGIAPNAKVIPVNIFRPGISTAEVAEAIDWAWEVGGADVLNNSWIAAFPSPDVSTAISDAIAYGRGGKGCVVVFCSGNDWMNNPQYPSNLPGVLAVGAINKNGGLNDYSSFGPDLDLVAPSGALGVTGEDGVVYLHGDIYSLDRMGSAGVNATNYLSNFGGTSAAAPQVSGAAALLLSLKPELTTSQITSYLTSTATDMGTAGFDYNYGYGRLNVSAAMHKVVTDYNMPGAASPVYGSVPLYDIILPNGYHYYATSTTGVSFTSYSILGYVFTSKVQGTVPLYQYMQSSNGNRYYTLTQGTYAGYSYEKIACYVYPNAVTKTLPVYEHFTGSGGGFYRYENATGSFDFYTNNDVKFHILQFKQAALNTLPDENTAEFYQFFHSGHVDHYYTTVKKDYGGWMYEKVLAYVSRIPRPNMIPLYQYFNPITTDHYYPTVKQNYGDYRYEGIAGYVYPTSGFPGTTPIYSYWHGTLKNHYYNPNNGATGPQYQNEGIKFYMQQYPY